jgi:hypothetical protein
VIGGSSSAAQGVVARLLRGLVIEVICRFIVVMLCGCVLVWVSRSFQTAVVAVAVRDRHGVSFCRQMQWLG